MKRKVTGIVVSVLAVLALLAAACAPAPAEETAPAPATPTAPAAPAAPAVKETAPAVKEAAPAVPEGMVKDSLGRLVEKPQYGGVLTSIRTSQPQYWDGNRGTFPQPMWDFLLQWDWAKGPAGTGEWDGNFPMMARPDLERGMLAESWEIPDPTTMVYHIRKGVRFMNKPPAFGRELNAYDVEFALRQSWTSPLAFNCVAYTAKDHFPDGSAEKAINATDKWTVVVKTQLKGLGAVYEQASTHYGSLVPPESLKYDMNDWRNAGGTGAFEVVDYVPASSITYRRNPNYWMKDPLHPENQLPYLDGYKQLIVPDASTRLAAIRTAKVDILGGASVAAGALSWEDTAQLKKSNPELKSYRFEQSSTNAIYMRVSQPELPWYDVRVRRALAMAIDNQAIANELYGGQSEVFAFPTSKNDKNHADIYIPLEQYPEVVRKLFGYYPEEAKQLMIAAGYPNGFKAEIIAQSTDIDMLSIVAAYWQKNLNVEMDIQVREPAVYTAIERYNTHKNMIAQSLTPAPGKLFQCRIGRDDRNSSRITDPFTEDLINKTLSGDMYFKLAERFKVLKEAMPYILEQVWQIQLPNPYITTVWHPWVKNYYGQPYMGYYDSEVSGLHYRYVWLDRDMKQAMTGRR